MTARYAVLASASGFPTPRTRTGVADHRSVSRAVNVLPHLWFVMHPVLVAAKGQSVGVLQGRTLDPRSVDEGAALAAKVPDDQLVVDLADQTKITGIDVVTGSLRNVSALITAGNSGSTM